MLSLPKFDTKLNITNERTHNFVTIKGKSTKIVRFSKAKNSTEPNNLKLVYTCNMNFHKKIFKKMQ